MFYKIFILAVVLIEPVCKAQDYYTSRYTCVNMPHMGELAFTMVCNLKAPKVNNALPPGWSLGPGGTPGQAIVVPVTPPTLVGNGTDAGSGDGAGEATDDPNKVDFDDDYQPLPDDLNKKLNGDNAHCKIFRTGQTQNDGVLSVCKESEGTTTDLDQVFNEFPQLTITSNYTQLENKPYRRMQCPPPFIILDRSPSQMAAHFDSGACILRREVQDIGLAVRIIRKQTSTLCDLRPDCKLKCDDTTFLNRLQKLQQRILDPLFDRRNSDDKLDVIIQFLDEKVDN